MTPVLLSDKSKLDEIYNLRVLAWENSRHGSLINRKVLPNGWKDTLEADAFHWVIFNQRNDIVASARLNILNSISDLPNYNNIKSEIGKLPNQFAYYSRLVVHPNYRGMGFSTLMDKAITKYIYNKLITTIAVADGKRIGILEQYGFKSCFSFIDKLFVNGVMGIESDFLILIPQI